MSADAPEWLVLVESNTTGSGRQFCARARELGLRPVVLARDPARYPYLDEDGLDTRVIDTSGADPVLAACADLPGRVAGVASSSEYFIATASEAAAALGLPHADAAAVRACRDKFSQRRVLRAAGVPGPEFAAATTPDEAVAAARRIGLPVVVKPVAGSGSIGVRRCDDVAEVRAAASYVLDRDPAELALPPQACVVIEEYLEGAEYSVETLDLDVIGVTRKHLGRPPFFVETGHDFPAPLPPGATQGVGAAAVAALAALGLGWGAAHIELRVTDDGPRIIEVNPRLAGGMIPRMVLAATGIDLIGQVVARAVGRRLESTSDGSGAAAIRFLVAGRSGRLQSVDGVEEARAVPGVVEVGLLGAPDRELVLRHSFQDRLAYVITAAADGPGAARAAEAGLAALNLRMLAS